MLQTSFLVIITLRFTCGERKICSTIKKSKNVNMIAAFLCIDICTLAIKYGHCSTNQIVHILHFNDNRIWTWNYSAPHREPKSGCNVLLFFFSSKLASYLTSVHRSTITHWNSHEFSRGYDVWPHLVWSTKICRTLWVIFNKQFDSSSVKIARTHFVKRNKSSGQGMAFKFKIPSSF